MRKQPNLFEAFFAYCRDAAVTCYRFWCVWLQSGTSVDFSFCICRVYCMAIRIYMGRNDGRYSRKKIKQAMPAILILISIGILIGTWMIAGTIPMMIYYGLKIIDPTFIVLIAFVVSAIISIVTGTSWGSAGTVGVALMGIATGLGASLPATAGAVVAGAYFGDKLSPLSDTTNIAPIAAGSELYEHIRHMLWTTVPAAILSMIVYFFCRSSFIFR